MVEASDARAALEELLRSWRTELDAARASQLRERQGQPWAARCASGLLLTELTFDERENKRSRDAFVWFRRTDRKPFPEHRLRSGYPALLWPASEADEQPGDAFQRGTIVRLTHNRVCMRFPKDYDRAVERGAMVLERESSEVTHQRGVEAIESLMTPASEVLRRLLFGGDTPKLDDATPLTFRDEALNETQQSAVALATRASQLALIHGPPGTGKTRTLVEVVRQALLLRKRILVTAASNIAVDNLARRLAACRVKVLRLGAAKKVAPDLAEHTLHHRMSQLPEWAEAQEHFDAAQRIVDGKGRKPADPKRRISELRRQAHACRDLARAKVMRRSRVVCATAGGVDAVPLGDEKFDLVVLDEATQAPDPVALAALVRGGVLVLAGDPEQLPPTVVTQEEPARARLTSTLFERIAARSPEITTMLEVQYRMSDELMRFPSTAHYGGRLRAATENRAHRLADLLGDAAVTERDAAPWIFVDTSGMEHREQLDEAHASFFHDGHRALVVREISRLVELGVKPEDIAAICPYSAQTYRLRRELAELVSAGLEIGTVDGFQGREKEVVIVDLVRANPDRQLGFLNDVRRTNVAITRAKRHLIVIAHGDTIASHPYYRDLLAAAKDVGAWEGV